MDKISRGAIIGMVLGDGCLNYRIKYGKDKEGVPKYKYEETLLRIGHSTKQEDYCIFKRDRIHSIFGGKLNKLTENTHKLSNSKTYKTVSFCRTDKYFRILHRWIYSNDGKKYFSRKILNMLTPEGLAYWFMDDGTCGKNLNRQGEVSSTWITISTYCSEEEADTILEYFKEVWDIQAKKGFCKRTKAFIIRFNTKETRLFAKIVSPYIIDSMQYKIEYIKYQDTSAKLLLEDEDIV